MVTIIDINDIPPIFEKPWTKENPYYTISCLEEQSIGSIIGKFIATDDSGIEYYDIIPNNPYIDVNQTTGNLIKNTILLTLSIVIVIIIL